MCDFVGATRSWFMLEGGVTGTRLYFGSVVTSRTNPRTGRPELRRGYQLLLGFHKLYSRACSPPPGPSCEDSSLLRNR